MADRQLDPARLSGEALRRWYLRSPDEIEQGRQAVAARRYGDFFDDLRSVNPNSGFSGGFRALESHSDLGVSGLDERPGADADPDFNRMTGLGSGWQAPETRQVGSALFPSLFDGQSKRPPSLDGARRSFNLSAAPPAPRPAAQVAAAPARAASARPASLAGAGTYRTPATPPKPSFFSSLFGGPAPITSPQGNVIGYYDHDAGKAGLQMTAAYASIAPFFHPAGWMEVVGTKASTPLLQAIDHGILEALQKHHPVPRHMGGRFLQELAPLRQSLHTEVHGMLRSAFKEAGLPNVGGPRGAKANWLAHFEANPESYNKALEILQRTTREFDKIRGTDVSRYLEKELARMAERTRGGGR